MLFSCDKTTVKLEKKIPAHKTRTIIANRIVDYVNVAKWIVQWVAQCVYTFIAIIFALAQHIQRAQFTDHDLENTFS